MHKYQIKDVSLPLCGEDNSLFVIRTPRWSLSHRDKMGHPPSSPATTLLFAPQYYYTPSSPNLAAADDTAVTMWQIPSWKYAYAYYTPPWRRQCSTENRYQFANLHNSSICQWCAPNCSDSKRQVFKFNSQFEIPRSSSCCCLVIGVSSFTFQPSYFTLLRKPIHTSTWALSVIAWSTTCRGWT